MTARPGAIVIVDYGMGNLRSVQKAFEAAGAKARISSKPRDVEKAGKIVLPGVGAFTHAMRELKKLKLAGPLREKILSGSPYLGLCLGLQLLFTRSEEGERVKGLDVIAGPVRRFRLPKSYKIPHMGWNTVRHRAGSRLFKGAGQDAFFYFVHSYYGDPEDKSWVEATTPYGATFASAVARGNVFATQFHPEKSQAEGQKLLKNFIAL